MAASTESSSCANSWNGQREYTSLGMVSSTESSSCANRMDRSRKRRKSRKAREGGMPIKNGQQEYTSKECGKACHIYKSKNPSSQRTQAGAISHKVKSNKLHFHAKRNRNNRQHRKSRKLHAHLINRVLPTKCSHLCWSHKSLAEVCLVFDGGMDDTNQLEQPSQEEQSKLAKGHKKPSKILPWTALRISKGDLWIADTSNPAKGITYSPAAGDPPFTRIPRIKALQITGLLSIEESNKFCIALNYGYKCQRGSLCRGKAKRIFSDYKYCNMGVQACRAGRGVRDTSYHRDGMPVEQWCNIVDMMKRTENALSSFVETKSLQQLNAAKQLLKFKTMASSHLHPNKIFGGLAFGINVHLSCHKDHDYTWSVVSVHLHGYQYRLVDRIVAYFCFPRLGIAVALRPGDLLVFNPTEPHAISSRCNSDDTVYCLSMYLKTAIVGLNDNSLSLTSTEEVVKDEYNNIKK